MASSNLTKALKLLNSAETKLHKIRLGTPVDYMDSDDAQYKITAELRKIDGEYLDAAMRLARELDEQEQDQFGRRFGEVNRTFEYIAGEKNAGRLPQLKEAPWPPAVWVAEDNMRADAAEAAAEPATNGYE